MRVVGGPLPKGVVAHRGGKEAISWRTVRSPSQQLQTKNPTHLSGASSSGPRAVVLKLVVVKKLTIVKKLKNKVAWKCKVPHENIGETRRVIQGMINNVNWCQNHQCESPRENHQWDHHMHITTATTWSSNGLSRRQEVLNTNHHENDWQNWPKMWRSSQVGSQASWDDSWSKCSH